MPTAESGFFEWVLFFLNKYGPLFLRGAGYTMLIALTGTIVGFLIGLGVGAVRSVNVRDTDPPLKKVLLRIVRGIFAAYISIFRSTPMMVQAMVIYYGAAQLFNLHMNQILAGFVIVSINTGAYMAEIVRGGIQSVDRGQLEAAQAVGMTHGQAMFHVVLPQAVRNILPSIGNEFVVNIKDTSVLNVISVTELFFESKSAAGTYFRYFEVFFITSVVYFVMTFTVTEILKFVERKMDGPSTYRIHGSQTSPDGELQVKESELP